MRGDALQTAAELLRFSHDLERALNAHLARYSLSMGRFSVLLALHRAEEGRLTPTLIAEHLFVTRGNVTGLLDGLDADGLIQRNYCTVDRRLLYISLSSKAESLLKQILPELNVLLVPLLVGNEK
jgi:DNA-binding MarR family transcriptional regulator